MSLYLIIRNLYFINLILKVTFVTLSHIYELTVEIMTVSKNYEFVSDNQDFVFLTLNVKSVTLYHIYEFAV